MCLFPIAPHRYSGLLAAIILFCGPAFTQEPAPDITDHYRRMMTYHTCMDGNVPEGAVLFIGDSITQGLCVAAVCERAVNYGIGSDTTVGVLERLPAYGSIARATAVVIAIGINDMSRRDNAAILDNYQKIIEAIPEGTRLLFSAVLPLDERVERITEGRNARIHDLNADLKKRCEESERACFVDAGPVLTDETGNLAADYHVGDGVHLNTRGYTLWIEALKEMLATMPDTASNH